MERAGVRQSRLVSCRAGPGKRLPYYAPHFDLNDAELDEIVGRAHDLAHQADDVQIVFYSGFQLRVTSAFCSH